MPRWLVRSVRSAALAALAIGGASALGQTMTGMGNADGQQQAQAFATAQQPATAAVVPNADVTQIPNSGGDTTGLQGYQSNPSALTAAGQNATSASDSLNTAMLATANANHNVVNNTDSWLQQSLNIIQNPTSIIQSDSGSQAQTCTTTHTQQTVTDDNGTYTCETSQQVTDSQQSCTQNLVVDTSSTYTYACSNTYDQTNRTWDISPACSALASTPACQATGTTCTQPPAPYFQAKQCTKGTEWNTNSSSCTETRNIVIGTNYNYACSNSYDQGSHSWDTSPACQALSSTPGCTQQSERCGVTEPPVAKTCQQGVQTTSGQQTCDPVRLITVGTNYVYDGTRNWNGSTWAPDGPEQALQNAGSTCQIQATNCTATQPPQIYTCKTGYTESASALVEHCIEPYSADEGNGPQNFGNYCFTDANPYNQLAYSSAEGNPDCHLDSSAQETDVNGVVYSEDNFSCHTHQQDAGCSPPSGATQTGSQCTAQNYAASCTEYTQTWSTPGQCQTWTDQWLCTAPFQGAGTPISTQQYVASDTWSNACASEISTPGCSKTGETVEQGPQTRDIDGLEVYRDSWQLHDTYTCQSQSSVDTCTGNVTGCTESEQSCAAQDANGNCTLWTYTYSCPGNDGSGGCERQDYTYTCPVDVQPADPAVSTSKYVQSDAWTTECAGLASNGACSLSSDTTDGTSTRVIDGLSITENGWTKTDTYSCWASQPIDGCTGNVNGCTQTGQTCAGADQNGNCSVWTYTYSCPADDGSGGCGVKTNTYTCSADVPPADPAQSVNTVVSGTHWDTTCQQSSDPTCQSQGTTCTDANTTKTVNGIQVTEGCWSQTTNYECEAKGPVQTDCNPPPGCTWDHDQCLDDPQTTDGSCTSMDHVYKCQEQTNKTVTQSSCSTQMCFSGQCFSISGANDSNDLGKAFSALSIGQMGGADYANQVNNLRIMSGTAMRCRKAVLGFSNCCKDSGWGESIGLASCDDQEKSLIKQQETKACHYVGTYCSNKSFFGVCLQKSMRYCCFEGSLARIVNEAGRPQVNRGWGSAKDADCSGFTIAQFQQLDLSNVDFSDFYSQALSGLAQPSASTATSNIQSTLNALYSGGTPVNPVAMPTVPTGP